MASARQRATKRPSAVGARETLGEHLTGQRARRVGTVVLVALAAAIGLFVFVLDDVAWGSRVRIAVYFHHTGGLREGAPVIVAGRSIGKVTAIEPAGHTENTPLHGDEGIVVTMDLSAHAADRVPRGGDVFIAGRGPLSARFLEIGPSPTPEGPSLADDAGPMRGSDPPTLDRALQRTWDNLVTAKQFADEVAPEFRALTARLGELTDTLDSLVPRNAGAMSLRGELDGLLDEVAHLRQALGGEDGIARLGATVARARETIGQARRMLDTLSGKAAELAAAIDGVRGRLGKRGPAAVDTVKHAIARLRAALDKIDPLLAKIEDINQRIQRGEGSLGRLAKDPEFPEDAKELGKILKRQPWRIFMRPKQN